ncbi:unnamed protein product [Closterium sp. NIES-54]
MCPASPLSVLSFEMFSRVCDMESVCSLDSSSSDSEAPYFRDSFDYNNCDADSACWEAELACSPIWIDEARSRIRCAALAVVETQQQSLHLTSLADSHMCDDDLSEFDYPVDGCSCASPKSSKTSSCSSKSGVLRFIASSLRLRK